MNPFKFFRSSETKNLEESLDREPTLKKSTIVDTKTGKQHVEYTATPSQGPEIIQLRESVATLDQRLQTAIAERDDIRGQFDSFRSASQAGQRELERENQRLRATLHETSQMLSQQIASSGHQGPVPSDLGEAEEPKGLQRAIAAAKRETDPQKPQPRLQRPTL